MKKILILAGGWFLTLVGGILTPIPMPLPFPFPIGITMLLLVAGELSGHRQSDLRRGIQYIRHHDGWLSRRLEIGSQAYLSRSSRSWCIVCARVRDGWLSRGGFKTDRHARTGRHVRDMVHRSETARA